MVKIIPEVKQQIIITCLKLKSRLKNWAQRVRKQHQESLKIQRTKGTGSHFTFGSKNLQSNVSQPVGYGALVGHSAVFDWTTES